MVLGVWWCGGFSVCSAAAAAVSVCLVCVIGCKQYVIASAISTQY